MVLKLSIMELPFMDQMLYTTLISMVVIAGVSLTSGKEGLDDDPKGISLNSEMFKTGRQFNISAYAIMLILVFLYAYFW